MKEYKYIENVHYQAGGGAICKLSVPIPCDIDYFIHALWMPLRHQIGDKLVFCSCTKDTSTRFSLWYNQLALFGDADILTKEQIDMLKKDAEKVIDTALSHISNFIAHLYGAEGTTPFLDTTEPIQKVEGNVITMSGRLPMQEEYFIKNYWQPLAKGYHKNNPGMRFGIHFHEKGTVVEIDAECSRLNAIHKKLGKPQVDSIETAMPILQLITCDVIDAIQLAAWEYDKARNNRN